MGLQRTTLLAKADSQLELFTFWRDGSAITDFVIFDRLCLLGGGFKLEVQRLGYCAVLLVASARVNARAKV